MTPQEKQQLKARFFGMHIGCKFEYKATVYSLQAISMTHAESGNFLFDLNCCKLILRPMESITDEEVFEAFNSAGLYGLEVFRDEDKIGIVGINGVSAVIWIKTSPLPIGAFLEVWNNIPNKSQPEYFEYMLVDYLRSKNFCLPFCGLDPVSEGWAVFE